MRHWTGEADERLDEMLDEHWRLVTIARRLGRTVDAVDQRRGRLGLPAPMARGYTSTRLAVLFDVTWRTVRAWLDHGFLRNHRLGSGRVGVIDESDLVDFLADERYWHEWDPERLTVPDLRAHARGERRGLRFYTPVELGRVFGLTADAVRWRIGQGYLRAVRRLSGEFMIRSDWLDGAPRALPGSHSRRVFSGEEDAWLRAWRPYQPVCHLAAALERYDTSVRQRCRRLGLEGPTVPPAERWTWRERRSTRKSAGS